MAVTWSEESGERGETGCHNKPFVLIDCSGVVVAGVVDICICGIARRLTNSS